DCQQPPVGPAAIDDVEAHGRPHLAQQRLLPPLRQVVEEISRSVSQWPNLRPPQAVVWVRAPPSRGRISPSLRGWASTLPAHHQNCTILRLAARGNADLQGRCCASRATNRRAPSHETARRSAMIASTSASRARRPTPITVPTPAARAATTPLGASSITTESSGSAPRRRMASAYPSGSGLPCATSSAVTNTGGTSMPEAASLAGGGIRLPGVAR